ncbi:MAG: FtsX-like permease family protein [Chloroflexi bacterium]|nr:FtsX-like permease family protein [Chloroflexota bacterium]
MNFVSILWMVVQRIRNNVRLLLATIAGLIIAVGIVSAIPLYSDAALQRLLVRELDQATTRPAGAVFLRHIENFARRTNMEQFQTVTTFFEKQVPSLVRLPITQYVRYGALEVMPVEPADPTKVNPAQPRYAAIEYQTGLWDHIDIVDGRLPTDQIGPGTTIEAVVLEDALDKLDFVVGSTFLVPLGKPLKPDGSGKFDPDGPPSTVAKVTVVGVWRPKNPRDAYWPYDPAIFDKSFFVHESVFFKLLEDPTALAHEYSWYYVFDHKPLRIADVYDVRVGLETINTRSPLLMQDTRLEVSPDKYLLLYDDKSFYLRLLLYSLSLPILGMVLYFLMITSNLVVDQQRNEIAVLKSRGASIGQIVGIYLIEGALIGGLALLIGPLLGVFLAQVIGAAYGFLLFVDRAPLNVEMTRQTWLYSLGAVAVAILATLLPAIAAARYSIVSYKNQVARSTRTPLWQKFFLDILLLGVAYYGYTTLSSRASILAADQAGNLLVDPFLLLIPAVFILAFGLLTLRLLPWIVRLLAWVSGKLPGVSILMALRQLSRQPSQYNALVLLMILTLALGTYSASAARTLGQNFIDRVAYSIGPDLVVSEAWQFNEEDQTWTEPPFGIHYEVPGIATASRVLTVKAQPQIGGRATRGEARVMGIDWTDFAKVTWWRRDFADYPLQVYMNFLGSSEDAILAQRDFAVNNNLKPGDRVTLIVNQRPTEFMLAGVVDYWPTFYPEKETFFIGNIDYILDKTGLQPYNVWMQLTPDAKAGDIIAQLTDKGNIVVSAQDQRSQQIVTRRDPQRTGLFGILSIGFIVAAVITVIGFLFYSFLSLRRRTLQFGVLRAMGLSVGQLITTLSFETIFLALIGVSVGTAVGLWASQLFVPFLQVSADATGRTPRFLIVTDWTDNLRIYVVLGIMLAVALGGLITLLARLNIHQAVKLGEDG